MNFEKRNSNSSTHKIHKFSGKFDWKQLRQIKKLFDYPCVYCENNKIL